MYLAGCGDFTDEGDGTRTLDVDVIASYNLDDDTTALRADVEVPSGSASGTEILVVDDESGDELILELDDDQSQVGIFRGSFSGYRRRLELNVERGSDRLDAKLEGPGRHVIEAPTNGQDIELDDIPNRGLSIEWSVEDGLAADQVRIILDVADFDSTFNEDEGEADIPRATLQIGTESIRVRRSTTIDLAGGVPGSRFEIGYAVSGRFVLTR